MLEKEAIKFEEAKDQIDRLKLMIVELKASHSL